MTDTVDRLREALASRYDIQEELGAGGMATVYLAHDVKHNRKVALKVLRPELSAVLGGERFLKEIEVTANLQHPNILPLYDSGEADAFLYYVMPYVEGEALRDRLNREKQLGIDETVAIARDVSAALHFAHERNVVHRDIKPENILLQDGRPLVADFGIALAVSQAGGTRLTETGLSIGTPHYMSPEQATGDRELDARSDIYSLGAMVYEMLAGEPPFTGSTVQAIVARILTEDPRPLSSVRSTVPPHVDAAVMQALARLPADRPATAARFADTMGGAVPVSVRVPAGSRSRTVRDRLTAVAMAGLALLAAWGWLGRPEASRPWPARFLLAFSPGQELTESRSPWSRAGWSVLSPGGRSIVYVGPSNDGAQQLWVRDFDRIDARPIPGTVGGELPFFSPDGRSIGFFNFQTQRLLVVPVDGSGPAVPLAGAEAGRGGDWGADGYIYFTGHPETPTHQDALFRVPATGGSRELMPATEEGVDHLWPDVLPNGRGVLVTVRRRDSLLVAAMDLGTGAVTDLTPGFHARYAAGYVFFADAAGWIHAARFDDERLRLTSAPRPVVENVVVDVGSVAAQFSVADDGTLLYVVGDASDAQLVWVDRDGTETPYDTTFRSQFGSLALSPDGRRLALGLGSTLSGQIWIHDLVNGVRSRLSQDGRDDFRAAWHPDGQRIAFVSGLVGRQSLFSQIADGSTAAESLLASVAPVQEVQWSADGRYLIYREGPSGVTARDLWYMDTSTGTRHALLATAANEMAPALSPDARWLAYVSDESGQVEVYVRPFPESPGRWQISSGGGREPTWSHSGRELFFRTANGDFVAVGVTPGAEFAIAQRDTVFHNRGYEEDVQHRLYTVAPDDERFLFIRRSSGNVGMVVVLHWLEELRALFDERDQ